MTTFANFNNARKEPGDYWKSVMNDQLMIEAIKGLYLHQNPASALGSNKKLKHFVKDFDGRHSLIIYHSNTEYKEENNPYANVGFSCGYFKYLRNIYSVHILMFFFG